MLGRHHLLLSVFTVAIPALIFIDSTNIILLILAGVAIGSLVPDSDSPDAAIFHEHVKGVKGAAQIINGLVGIFLPAFGWVTKHMIYRPALYIFSKTVLKKYNISEHHRGFLHSFLGITVATLMIGIYLVPVLLLLDALTWKLLLFLPAYFLGAFLHLVEDSCTVTGIQFNYPFSKTTIKGKLVTRPDQAKIPNAFTTILGALTLAQLMTPILNISKGILLLIDIFLILLCWTIFLLFFAQIEPTREEIRIPSNIKSYY